MVNRSLPWRISGVVLPLAADFVAKHAGFFADGVFFFTWRADVVACGRNETNSLRAKMKAIKKATRAQYGPSSAQFAEVKSIKL